MDIEILNERDRKQFPGQGMISRKHAPADVWVVKTSELGINDNPVHTRTHLGHLLKPGDAVMGYNLEDANINDENFEKLKSEKIPSVVLVRKSYGDKLERSNYRAWKLKHLSEFSEDRTGENKK